MDDCTQDLPPLFYLWDFYNRALHYCVQKTLNGYIAQPVDTVPDPLLILGPGTTIVVNGQSHFAAYFSASRGAIDEAPKYEDSFFFMIDGAVYDCYAEGTTVSLQSKLLSRTLCINAANQAPYRLSYPWPFYRELTTNLVSDPFNFKSADFFYEATDLLHFFNQTSERKR
jgi:hypothetical protein